MIVTEVRRRLCKYILAWKKSGKLELFVEVDSDAAVFAIELFNHLAESDDTVPDEIASALGLPVGSSYAKAMVLMKEAWSAPIIQTPEEEAEDEMSALKMSALFEQLNAENPDMPQLPVAYPKKTRQLQ